MKLHTKKHLKVGKSHVSTYVHNVRIEIETSTTQLHHSFNITNMKEEETDQQQCVIYDCIRKMTCKLQLF